MPIIEDNFEGWSEGAFDTSLKDLKQISTLMSYLNIFFDALELILQTNLCIYMSVTSFLTCISEF